MERRLTFLFLLLIGAFRLDDVISRSLAGDGVLSRLSFSRQVASGKENVFSF
jgi:hypothetical protein